MANITTQIQEVFTDGKCGRTSLFAVKNATAGDTLDVGAFFSVVKLAGLVSNTGATIAGVSNTGTVLTIPAGPAQDGVWLLIVGVSK